MEIQKQTREELYERRDVKSNFEVRLQDTILNHLNLLSEEGKEKVLDYINTLVDAEQRRLEFNRRQGRLYNWVDAEE